MLIFTSSEDGKFLEGREELVYFLVSPTVLNILLGLSKCSTFPIEGVRDI